MWQARPGLAVTAVLGALAIAVVAAGARTVAAPTRAQMKLMPLPQQSFGAAAAALKPAAPKWIDDVSAASLDLAPTSGGELAAMGRVTGYSMRFEDAKGQFRRGRLIEVGSEVDLFRTGADARAYVAFEASTVRRYEGHRTKRNGTILTDVEQFGVAAPTGALGARLRARFGRQSAWLTFVFFRVGPIVGNVVLLRTDARDLRADARRSAKALDLRIKNALRG
jgi:hypothetical protein